MCLRYPKITTEKIYGKLETHKCAILENTIWNEINPIN